SQTRTQRAEIQPGVGDLARRNTPPVRSLPSLPALLWALGVRTTTSTEALSIRHARSADGRACPCLSTTHLEGPFASALFVWRAIVCPMVLPSSTRDRGQTECNSLRFSPTDTGVNAPL